MILTRRQKEVRDYLEDFIATHGYAPTLEEIGAHFGLSSLATVHKHLSNLERKGLITRKWNLSRAIEIPPPAKLPGPSNYRCLVGWPRARRLRRSRPLTPSPFPKILSGGRITPLPFVSKVSQWSAKVSSMAISS